jgi:hypothetical protein
MRVRANDFLRNFCRCPRRQSNFPRRSRITGGLKGAADVNVKVTVDLPPDFDRKARGSGDLCARKYARRYWRFNATVDVAEIKNGQHRGGPRRTGGQDGARLTKESKMFVRFLCNWPPYLDGQCVEIPDRVGADFVARYMAQIVTPADVHEYSRTMTAIDRAIEKRISEKPVGGRCVISEDQWAREIGRDRAGYRKARQAFIDRRINVPARLPAALTMRS